MGLTAYDWRLGSLRLKAWQPTIVQKSNRLHLTIAYTLWLRKPTIEGLAAYDWTVAYTLWLRKPTIMGLAAYDYAQRSFTLT